ncbi:MAG: AzlC family ABC transporter permease [Saccharofermentans sp.]|nr:AzlC family ABC transporter permease [Saccharofermentans sp.]
MKELRFALKQTFPIFFTYVFLGIAFGVMMIEAGFSILTAILCSVFIYAGSMQIAMIPMLISGSSFPLLAIMTLFINGRHLFYGVGFIEKFRKSGWRYPYMVFALTDETYSILCSVKHPTNINEKNADFFIALTNQCYWILGSLLGAVAGSFLPFDLSGIEFSATAFFLVVVLNQLSQYKSKIPALTGLISAVVFLVVLGPEYFIIPTLTVTLITLIILRDVISRKMEVAHG